MAAARTARCYWVLYLALLQSSGVGVLGALADAEVNTDVEAIGAVCGNERRT